MLQQDLNQLQVPYSDPGSPGDQRFLSALSSDVPSSRALSEDLLNDLDVAGNGLRTMASLPQLERILLGDYLYQCATSIEVNLSEARLHFLEWKDCADKQSSRLARSLVPAGQTLALNLPKSQSAYDDLPNALEKLHIGGFFRAIGSSLDCLAAVIIGVTALKTGLRKADMTRTRAVLSRVVDDGTLQHKIRIRFYKELESIIAGVGPDGWLEWSDQLRNMLVHRGRRTIISEIILDENLLYDAQEQLVPRAILKTYLPKFPDKTDIEAMLTERASILNEEAHITFEGVFRSTRNLLEATCGELVALWRSRVADPSLLSQPIEQWQREAKQCNFAGYEDRSAKPKMDTLTSSPTLMKRFKAASGFDHQNSIWRGSKWTAK